MFASIKLFRIFWIALIAASVIVIVKYNIHALNLEIIEQSSLHNSVVSSVVFVIGFLLSATIADYKESERIPSDFAANIEDMYNDAVAVHGSYPVFDIDGFRIQLQKIANEFGSDVRNKAQTTKKHINELAPFYAAMETGKVPPNFIVKLKQQSTLLLRSQNRVNYIQQIKFIPSATILARSIAAALILLLMFTNIDPFYGGLAIVGIISFVLVYVLVLISIISTPFHAAGKTRDDVSLFLVSQVAKRLAKK